MSNKFNVSLQQEKRANELQENEKKLSEELLKSKAEVEKVGFHLQREFEADKEA